MELSEPLKVPTVMDMAIKASEDAKPSSDPDYWAKRSCNHCYGRGIVGQMSSIVQKNTIVQNLLCTCSKKNFQKWRDNWIKNYLATGSNAPATVVDIVK